MTTSGAALLAKIKPRLRRVPVHICLRPDLISEWERKDSELLQSYNDDLAAAGPEGRARLVTQTSEVEEDKILSDQTRGLARDVDKIEKQIEAADTVFWMEALPKDEWAAHVAKHSPRDGNHYDVLAGYDRDAALDAGVRLCLVDPVFEDCVDVECDHSECGTWQAFLRVCASSEWEELKNGVSSANTETRDNPKSPWATKVLARSAASSASPKNGASRSARTTGGRPGK